MTNLENNGIQNPVTQTVTVNEVEEKAMMESQMSVSFSEIDSLFKNKGYSDSRVDSRAAWLDTWYEGKKEIFRKWGNKLRFEKEVELGISDSQILSGIRDALASVADSDKLEEKSSVNLAGLVLASLPPSDLASNTISENRVLFQKKINKGMRITRMLRLFELPAVDLDLIQTALSTAIQSFKATGTLVVSIDPIDILTMSYNPDSEWRSCHHIFNGEYRTGPLSYLGDKATFVSYTYKRKALACQDLEIPNKTWRNLGYYTDDLSTAIFSTQYPSRNDNNLTTMFSLIEEIHGGGYTRKQMDTDYLMYMDGFEGRKYHYNDLSNGRSSYFNAFSEKAALREVTNFNQMKEHCSVVFPIGSTAIGITGEECDHSEDILGGDR